MIFLFFLIKKNDFHIVNKDGKLEKSKKKVNKYDKITILLLKIISFNTYLYN